MSDPACSATIITQADVIALLDKQRHIIELATDLRIELDGANIARWDGMVKEMREVARELREIGQACE